MPLSLFWKVFQASIKVDNSSPIHPVCAEENRVQGQGRLLWIVRHSGFDHLKIDWRNARPRMPGAHKNNKRNFDGYTNTVHTIEGKNEE
jgi:hypothetical protein